MKKTTGIIAGIILIFIAVGFYALKIFKNPVNNMGSTEEATSASPIDNKSMISGETTGIVKSLTVIAEGAVLKDDFDDKTLDFNKWKLMPFITQDWVSTSEKTMRLAGHLERPQKNIALAMGNTSGSDVHLGLVSQRYPTNDVVAVGRMKVVSMPKLQSGNQKYLLAVFHVCNMIPDFFSEIRFGNSPSGEFGWTFFSRDEKDTYSKVVPAFGDEATSFYTVKVERDGLTNKTSAYIERDNKWIKIGEASDTHRFATQIELKDISNADGVDIDTRFDDVRLYPHPDHAPVRFVLTGPSPRFTYPVSNSDSLTLKLFQADGVTLIGEGKNTGEGAFEVKLSRDLTFPIGGVIKIYSNGKETGSAKIAANGVDGLYPGDIWSVNINTGNDAIQQNQNNQQGKCGDGKCDDFEKSSGMCPDDCK